MVSGCYSIITRSYANPNPSPPSLMANKSCCRNISYEEYCGKSIWLKPREPRSSLSIQSQFQQLHLQVCACGNRSDSPYARWIENRCTPCTPCKSTKPLRGTREE